MLLTGTHPRTLDDKHRLTLPKRVRQQLGSARQLFISPGPDRCLWVFDKPGLEGLTAKLDEVPATDSEARVFRRLFFAQMETVDIDTSSRVLLPERLLELAGLKHEVVLIGVQNHLEVWDTKSWNDYLAQNGPRFDAVAEKAFKSR
jgi:MraZ protein